MEEKYNDSNGIDLSNVSDCKDDMKDIPRISMFSSQDKKSQSQMRLKKRRKSLPLKQFKVSLPSEAKTLSLICDNIFEDDVLNENINSSMIKLKSNINLKNTRNNEEININIKTLNVNLEKSKTISTQEKNNSIKDEIIEEEDDFPQGPRPHKKSFIFNNIIKIKKIKCPRLLEEQWKYEKILLDYNIIDFTSKIKFIIF